MTPKRLKTIRNAARAGRSALNTYRRADRRESRSTVLGQYVKQRRLTLHGKRGVIPVTASTAVSISAVFASVRILSGLLSSLPLKVYERQESSNADVEATQHPVADLFRFGPNPDDTPAIYKEAIGRDYWLFGNSYSEQAIDWSTGETFDVFTHHASNVEPFRDDDDLDRVGRPRKKYAVRSYEGGERIVDRSMMIHAPALGFDGLCGASVVTLAAQSMGIALSGDNLAAQFNNNAAKPFLIVEYPDYLDDEPHRRLVQDINNEWKGDDAFGSMLLEGGGTAKTLTMPLKDAQFLETRKFQGEEIAARWFGLPPHLAGYLDRAHFNNVEEQDRALLVFTLAPALVRIEEEFNRKIFRRAERGRLYVKFNVDALLRPQQKERFEAHKSALMSGWKTVNEVRALEDLPPMPGGDILARPASIFGNNPTAGFDDPDQATVEETNARIEQQNDQRSLQAVAAGLIESAVDALHQAERRHVERFAKHRDESRVREWYEQHERRAIDKLSPIGAAAGPLLDHYREHRDQVIEALRTPNVGQALDATLDTWSDDSTALAADLVALLDDHNPQPNEGEL